MTAKVERGRPASGIKKKTGVAMLILHKTECKKKRT